MKPQLYRALLVGLAALVVAVAGGTTRKASAALPPGNTVEQWNKIAEDTVVGSGAFQNEGLLYMAYESEAVYDAVTALDHRYQPLLPAFRAWRHASVDAAVIEAAYQVLSHYFPAAKANLDAMHAQALGSLQNGPAKVSGQKVGWVAANQVIRSRTKDGLETPIGVTSAFTTHAPGAGVWRLTPPAYQPPQTPWVANVHPFILKSAAQYLPPPPPSLTSSTWVNGFNEIKAVGGANSTVRTADQTNIAKFWTANVIRQYNGTARSIIDKHSLSLTKSARLTAMVNVIGEDAQISVMYAKYHYLFWRPVTAIDPTSVSADGFGPTPGFNDGNTSTAEQTGWRPLIATPNHPEYPAAHGSITGAMSEVFANFLGSKDINLDIHGFDPNGPAGNLTAVRHFNSVADVQTEIVNARLWAGLHYRFSGVAGADLGRNVAAYDLKHAFLTGG